MVATAPSSRFQLTADRLSIGLPEVAARLDTTEPSPPRLIVHWEGDRHGLAAPEVTSVFNKSTCLPQPWAKTSGSVSASLLTVAAQALASGSTRFKSLTTLAAKPPPQRS